MTTMLLEDAEILTMVPGQAPFRGGIRIDGERIAELGDLAPRPGEARVACRGLTALPGFVQGHVHLCQVLFRNLAEGLPLLEWLRRRIWPLEAAHDSNSLRASARLGLYELVAGGCTTFQSMETVHGTEHVLAEVASSGLRAVLGNSLMDRPDAGVPRPLLIGTEEALRTSRELRAAWDGKDGRIHFAFCPRFLLACSDELLRELACERQQGARLHTHAAEHRGEVDAVMIQYGKRYLHALSDLGLLGPTTTLAHCVHLDATEESLLVATGTAVLHCPSTNLKLGSGIAPIVRYRQRGIRVALGADGAPANNRIDCLTELRQAALLQCLQAGPGALEPFEALSLLTREGAAALGLEADCGTLEPGKAADLVLLDLEDPRLGPGGDLCTRIVFAADRSHVRHVMAAGRFLVHDGIVQGDLGDRAALESRARDELGKLLGRAEIVA
jgi:5-methylthioadenosine/S-adenosylhomocysteine deaminase